MKEEQLKKEKEMRFNKIDSESIEKSSNAPVDPEVPVLKKQIGDLKSELS